VKIAPHDPFRLLTSERAYELKLNVGVSLFERLTNSKEKLEIDEWRDTQQQLAAPSSTGRPSGSSGTLCKQESLLCIFDEGPSRVGNLHVPTVSFEKFYAQLFLDIADLLAQGGLRHMDTFRRSAKVEFRTDSNDVAHGA
jgi:hypothetical protein